MRFAHLSPDTPAVDVALAPLPADGDSPLTDPGPDVATGLRYGEVGAYASVSPGRYAVSVRAAGTPRTTPPRLTARVDVPAGGARTVALTGTFAELSLQVLEDDVSTPPRGAARVHLLVAAAGAARLDATLQGERPPEVLARGLTFGSAGPPAVVPAGAATLRIASGSGPSTDLPLELPAGSVLSLIVLDRPDGGLTVRIAVDVAAPTVTPTGPVEAGGGGPARPSPATLATCLLAAGAVAGLAGRRRRRLLLPLAAALVAGPVPSAIAATPSPPPVTHVAAPPTLETAQRGAAASPVRVTMPSVGVDTPLAALRLDRTGALVPPADPRTAGWFAGGPPPGDPGPAVLTGHVDSVTGPGAFFRIGQAAIGDPVDVGRADGTTVHFTVVRVVRYPKDGFPTAAVYGPTPGPELRLITCGGRFDRSTRSYVDDVVVYARVSGTS